MRGLLQRIRLRLIELRPYPSYAARRRLRLGALGLLLIAAGGAGGWLLSDQLGDDDSGGPAPAPTVVIREDVEPEAAEELGFPAFATVNTTRVGGSDSIAVAAGVALAAIPATGGVEGPAAVALVEADDWATGIAAASLFANPIGIPLLLGSRGQVPQFTQEAIAELAPEGSRATKQAQIYRIGEVEVPGGLKTVDVNGSGPIELANSIDKVRGRLGPREPAHLVFASLDEPELAMPAAAWAALSGDPVLYLSGKEIPAATLEAIERHPDTPGYVLGSEAAVPDRVVRAIGRRLPSVKRVGAANPVENAIEFARYADGTFGWDINLPGHGFVVVNSARPADAGAAAALSGLGKPGPLLLTDDPDTLPVPLEDYMIDMKPGFRDDPTEAFFNHIWLIGDESAITVGLQTQLDTLTEHAPESLGQGLGDLPGPAPFTPEDEAGN